MPVLWILFGILCAVILAVLAILAICFKMAFFVPHHGPVAPDEYPIPDGDIYEPYRDTMVTWMKQVREMGPEELSIVSYDGLTLHGKYYEFAPGAPIELMMHGYRGQAERDLCGGVLRCFALGHSALIIDQRACGASDGHVITFGIKESRDCLSWVEFMRCYFGEDVRIILTGISMGASTVLMAAGQELPEQVIAVLADCGYSTPKAIIQEVIQGMGLPVKASYPFVRWSAKLFGGFDIESNDPIQAAKQCKVPVILFHGESDDFVPCRMSKEIYDALPGHKKLVTIPGAGHGLSYVVAPERYIEEASVFFGPIENKETVG